MNNHLPHVSAYVSFPFLGESFAERGGARRGRYFFDYLAERGQHGWAGLTVFVGKWAIDLDQPMPKNLVKRRAGPSALSRSSRPIWLAAGAPILALAAVVKAVME